jgi:hypothetical protein
MQWAAASVGSRPNEAFRPGEGGSRPKESRGGENLPFLFLSCKLNFQTHFSKGVLKQFEFRPKPDRTKISMQQH